MTLMRFLVLLLGSSVCAEAHCYYYRADYGMPVSLIQPSYNTLFCTTEVFPSDLTLGTHVEIEFLAFAPSGNTLKIVPAGPVVGLFPLSTAPPAPGFWIMRGPNMPVTQYTISCQWRGLLVGSPTNQVYQGPNVDAETTVLGPP